MRYFIIIILILIITGCSVTSSLNKKIDSSQRRSRINSPFISKDGLSTQLKAQIKYRTKYEADLKNILNSSPNDTIILIETYSELCSGYCPAEHVQVFYTDKIIVYKLDYTANQYLKEIKTVNSFFIDSEGYLNNDIAVIMKELRDGNNWNQNPEKYGTLDVHGGGYTFYTILYPDGKIESMYIRSWTMKIFDM